MKFADLFTVFCTIGLSEALLAKCSLAGSPTLAGMPESWLPPAAGHGSLSTTLPGACKKAFSCERKRLLIDECPISKITVRQVRRASCWKPERCAPILKVDKKSIKQTNCFYFFTELVDSEKFFEILAEILTENTQAKNGKPAGEFV